MKIVITHQIRRPAKPSSAMPNGRVPVKEETTSSEEEAPEERSHRSHSPHSTTYLGCSHGPSLGSTSGPSTGAATSGPSSGAATSRPSSGAATSGPSLGSTSGKQQRSTEMEGIRMRKGKDKGKGASSKDVEAKLAALRYTLSCVHFLGGYLLSILVLHLHLIDFEF